MGIRRVVTGHTSEGKSTIASDTEIDPILGSFFQLWGADGTPTFPDDGSPLPYTQYFPPVGGFRFGLFIVPPQSIEAPKSSETQAIVEEFEEKLPGLIKHMENDHPGMHTTKTVDFEYVVSGEVCLELDDGKEIHLRAGDTVIQNGTRHAWRNKGPEPCRIVVCMIGAHRR